MAGFSVIASTALIFGGLNVLLKRWSCWTAFAGDDSGALRVLRMFDPGDSAWCRKTFESLQLQNAQTAPCKVHGGWSAKIALAMSFEGIAFPGIFASYGLASHSGRLSTVEHAMFWGGFVLFWVAFGPASVSSHFLASVEGLRQSIERFAIWDFSPETGTVDFCRAYQNFYIMAGTVRSFSAAWARFFFVAEFGLVMAVVCLGVGTAHEIDRLIDEISISSEVSLAVGEQAFRAAAIGGWFVMMFAYMVCIFAAGASLTAASKGVALRAHTLTLQLAMVDAEKAVRQGELFERQVSSEFCPPFEGFGIAITRSLGAKVVYLTISVGMTVLFSLLTNTRG